MSLLNFSNNLFSIIWNTSEELPISNIEITDNLELEHIRVKCYKRNSPGGAVTLRLYNSSGAIVCESNTIQLSEITSNFLGLIRFDFQRNNIQAGNYILKAEISGPYLRFSYGLFFSMIYDFPVKIYSNTKKHFDEHSIAIEVFGRN